MALPSFNTSSTSSTSTQSPNTSRTTQDQLPNTPTEPGGTSGTPLQRSSRLAYGLLLNSPTPAGGASGMTPQRSSRTTPDTPTPPSSSEVSLQARIRVRNQLLNAPSTPTHSQILSPIPAYMREFKAPLSTSSSSSSRSIATKSTLSNPSQPDTPNGPAEEPPRVDWGWMVALDDNFHSQQLLVGSDSYLFGRASSCDYAFDVASMKLNADFRSFGKVHFRVQRRPEQLSRVFVTCCNANGMYVAGNRLGKNQECQLVPGNTVALCRRQNVLFKFVDVACLSATCHQHPQTVTRRYFVDVQLGQGSYGEVHLAYRLQDGAQLALKVVKSRRESCLLLDPLRRHAGDDDDGGKVVAEARMREARILQALTHPCVIRIHEVITFERDLYMALEYAPGGDLMRRVAAGVDERDCLFYFYQVLLAVDYLHGCNVTHRDVKPDNVLLMSKARRCLVKVTDFGHSRIFDAADARMHSIVGTIAYTAPELFSSNVCIWKGPETQQVEPSVEAAALASSPAAAAPSSAVVSYSNKIDLWSAGVSLYVCLSSGLQPFNINRIDVTGKNVPTQICDADYAFAPADKWSAVGLEARHLVAALLTVDPERRLSAAEALQHRWFDAETRSGVEQLLPAQYRGDGRLSPSVNRIEDSPEDQRHGGGGGGGRRKRYMHRSSSDSSSSYSARQPRKHVKKDVLKTT